MPDTRGEVAAVPDVPEPPDVGGEPGADEAPAAVPDTQLEDATISDSPEPPGGESGTKTPPGAHSTPDTAETEPEAGDIPQAAVPVEPHADAMSHPGAASAAGGMENEAGHNTPGQGPDSTAGVERPPDASGAAPPKTSGGETSMQGGAGTGTSGDAPPAMLKDIHEDASGRPGEGRVAGDGSAPPDPDGDDSDDLEKIKADIIKTLNRLQRAEDD